MNDILLIITVLIKLSIVYIDKFNNKTLIYEVYPLCRPLLMAHGYTNELNLCQSVQVYVLNDTTIRSLIYYSNTF